MKDMDSQPPEEDSRTLVEMGQRLRDLRRRRGLTLQALSEESGVSTGMISQMERGVSSPSIRTLQRIAEALEMPIGWFFSDGPKSLDTPPWVLRCRDRRSLAFGNNTITKEILSPAGEGAIELLYVTIQPGGSSGEAAYTHLGEDAGLVLEGSMWLQVNGERCLLNSGDAFRFPSTLPHRFDNPGPGRAVILWAVTPPFY
jgi:transcriptional regulator with XRE-family HTH domain